MACLCLSPLEDANDSDRSDVSGVPGLGCSHCDMGKSKESGSERVGCSRCSLLTLGNIAIFCTGFVLLRGAFGRATGLSRWLVL